MPVDDGAEAAFSVGEVVPGECGVRGAELELREEIARRKKPLDAMALAAVAIEDQNRRGPLRVVFRAQPLVLISIGLHVHANGNEVFRHE